MKKAYCLCGCGQETKLSQYTDSRQGCIKGKSLKYLNGHNNRKSIRYLIDQNGCWIWQLNKYLNGYGQIKVKGKVCLAHRYYYLEAYGGIPENLVIDHLCGRKDCVNPEHLQAVTQKENIIRAKTYG